MENRQQTLFKIAEDLKLSKTTVSVCLSGNAEKGRVKPETVERVKKHAEKINYIPNRIARSLTKPGKSPVGLIIRQDSSSEKSLYAMRKAMQMLDENGREFIVQNFLSNHISDAVAALKGMNVREIIMFGIFSEQVNVERIPQNVLMRFQADQARLAALLQDVKFYAVDYDFPVLENCSLKIYRLGINRDDIYAKLFTALFKAVNAPIACDENCISAETRNALAGLGFEIKPTHIIVMPDNPVENLFKIGHNLVQKVIAMIKADQIKTVVLHNDKIAAGLIDGLLANGYSVPGDISVIGFDNIDASPYFKVPLTTIELPVMENTVTVVDAILKGMEIPRVIESDAQILWRDSAKL
ncbi:MAG: LacI family DNA-binding transcriptional regulator [Victivallaceae bacterium]|jgi:DNA-binding LacI/PurR family transcriptional regulator